MLIEYGPDRVYDPLQSALAHLSDGVYGTYEGLCRLLWLSPVVPTEIKEGLRFLSAATIGCAYCRTVREVDAGGERLLPDRFYQAVGGGDRDWEAIVPAPWPPLFEAAAEALADRPLSPATMERATAAGVTVAQLVEALFFMLVIGASHRFSVAFGVEESCPLPARLLSGRAAGAEGGPAG
jgi:hypothetical protein